jgi:hypothetical protein
MRVAAVFDNELRPETTGIYCRHALSKLANVEVHPEFQTSG